VFICVSEGGREKVKKKRKESNLGGRLWKTKMWEKGPWIMQENSCGNKQKSHNIRLKAYGHHMENVVKC
jgi:hypothetical protein